MPSGILLLDKPLGLSSNTALQRVRALLRGVKAGHAGSLDPLATGMLPICLGEATKVAGELGGARKRYRFRVALGIRTETADAEGQLIERAPVPNLERATVEAALARVRARGEQIPPMYSALKRDGQPLYRLARAGVVIERAPRPIELSELALVALETEALEIEVLCSKGTYVRVLAEDIAGALGTVGHVTELRRLYVEPFERDPMSRLEEIAAACARGEWPPLIAPDAALAALPAVHLPAGDARRVVHGQTVITHPPAAAAARVRLYDESGNFLGIGASDPSGAVRPHRLFNRARS
jgi:tRNA pseudouridine55 synthase